MESLLGLCLSLPALTSVFWWPRGQRQRPFRRQRCYVNLRYCKLYTTAQTPPSRADALVVVTWLVWESRDVARAESFSRDGERGEGVLHGAESS